VAEFAADTFLLAEEIAAFPGEVESGTGGLAFCLYASSEHLPLGHFARFPCALSHF
jgi:hypothetical protein